jgi:ribonuclease inhibitor
LKEQLSFPDYYGENLNALWDCLTAWVDLPLKIVWINFEESKTKLGTFAEEALDLFKDAQKELDEFAIEMIP